MVWKGVRAHLGLNLHVILISCASADVYRFKDKDKKWQNVSVIS